MKKTAWTADRTNQEFVAEGSCRDDQRVFIRRLSLVGQLTVLLFADDGVTKGQEGQEAIDVFVVVCFQDLVRHLAKELITNGTFFECHHVLQ